ncbi:MAG: ParD-like family protein [Chromatiaceae bacterium]|nr:ParD-like family protein [Chromatiaceae bacterium]
MRKSASPIRLQEDLMQSASLAGSQLHRSAAEQIEYWAWLAAQTAA